MTIANLWHSHAIKHLAKTHQRTGHAHVTAASGIVRGTPNEKLVSALNSVYGALGEPVCDLTLGEVGALEMVVDATEITVTWDCSSPSGSGCVMCTRIVDELARKATHYIDEVFLA